MYVLTRKRDLMETILIDLLKKGLAGSEYYLK